MSKKAKTSLKLPIFLIIGPALAIVLSIIVYAIVNFALSGLAPETSTNTDGMSLSDGASIAQGADSQSELFGEDSTSLFRTISNVVLFLVGSVSVLALVPCLVFGIIILNKRRNPQHSESIASTDSSSRNWGDLE